jgi:hypothetical protein
MQGVRAMTTRMLTAGVLGLLALGGTLVPVETSARVGAMSAPRAMVARVAPRAPIMRPVAHRPVALPTAAPVRPLARAPHVPPVPSLRDARRHADHIPPRRYRTYGFGLPITVYGDTAYYGTAYDPAETLAPYDPYIQPAYPTPTIVGYPPLPPDAGVLPGEPRQCRSQVQTVPKYGGGELSITIVRC